MKMKVSKAYGLDLNPHLAFVFAFIRQIRILDDQILYDLQQPSTSPGHPAQGELRMVAAGLLAHGSSLLPLLPRLNHLKDDPVDEWSKARHLQLRGQLRIKITLHRIPS